MSLRRLQRVRLLTLPFDQIYRHGNDQCARSPQNWSHGQSNFVSHGAMLRMEDFQMTRATSPAGSLFASQAKKKLIATPPKLEITLTPLRNLNLLFSNRNKKRVFAIELFRGLLITRTQLTNRLLGGRCFSSDSRRSEYKGLQPLRNLAKCPRGICETASGLSSWKFYSQQGANRNRRNLFKTKDRVRF